MPNRKAHPAHLFAMLALGTALGACHSPGKTEKRIAALEEDVADLKQQLAMLKAHPPTVGAAPKASERDADAGTAASAPEETTVEFIFDVTPTDAAIEVDGQPVSENRWHGERHSGFHTVHVSRTGFRTLVQQVSTDEPQRLVYRLVRGRGVAHVPPR